MPLVRDPPHGRNGGLFGRPCLSKGAGAAMGAVATQATAAVLAL